MMKFDQLVILLPCYSLETFSLEHSEEDSEQLLAGWSALWHPVLLASAKAIPRWVPAENPPAEETGLLAVLPSGCESMLPEGWLERAEAAGACVLRNLRKRDQMVAAALNAIGEDRPSVDPELAADFLALGFCHFQVEILTRKLRYMSNLDESSLRTSVLAAADEAIQGNVEAAKEHLHSAFDRLHEAREYFYPTETRLLDLTLVAPSTLGAPLREELAGKAARNLLITGEVIEIIANREPETLEQLKQALANDTLGLIGGEFTEIALPMLEPEAIRRHLDRGLACYETHLPRRPIVFGRRRFGLTPVLPQILRQRGFTGAIHFTLDDGRFPTGNQSRIQWDGIDSTSIEALGSLPIDASRSDSFMRLPERLSNAMNLDQSSTVVFAHWPGKSSPWYEDIRRSAAYGSVFGSFVTINDYFERTAYAGQSNYYKPDQYRSPYLVQDVAAGRADPISRWVRYFRRRATLEAAEATQVLTHFCGTKSTESQDEQLAALVEECLYADRADSETVDAKLAGRLQQCTADLAQVLCGSANATRGCLWVNPWSSPQQACSRTSTEVGQSAVVDVPAMGFAWGDPNVKRPEVVERKGWFGRRKTQEPPPLAEENVLRNEFVDIQFDPHTGAIRTICDYQSRNPRLAQQIALRLPQGGESGADANYSIMAADELTVTSTGPVLGEMVARGRLLDREGRRVAGFRQTTRVWRGCRVIEVLIDLDIQRQPGPNAWDSYYAVRFAWKDDAAVLHRSVSMADMPTELMQFESPHFVDIRRGTQRTTLLMAGLPYHRRHGPRKLDTLLVTQGETARSFRLGIGIDVPSPMGEAMAFLSPPVAVAEQPQPTSPVGWLFHLDCRNVLATHWETFVDGEAQGFRVRLLETEGRRLRAGLRCFRQVASARRIEPDPAMSEDLVVEGDRINVPIGSHEWIEVEGRFA